MTNDEILKRLDELRKAYRSAPEKDQIILKIRAVMLKIALEKRGYEGEQIGALASEKV